MSGGVVGFDIISCNIPSARICSLPFANEDRYIFIISVVNSNPSSLMIVTNDVAVLESPDLAHTFSNGMYNFTVGVMLPD